MLDALFDVAEGTGKAVPQIALNWLLQRPGVTAPIIGARNLEQLESNIGASGWTLDEDQMARLTGAGATELPYPYSHISGAEKRR